MRPCGVRSRAGGCAPQPSFCRDRRGQTGQVHNAMFNFGANGELKWNFDGGDLLQGETDGSSYMNGGLRVRRASPTRTPD